VKRLKTRNKFKIFKMTTAAKKDDKKIIFIQNDDNTFVNYFRELHSRYRLDFRKANRAYKTNIASRVVLAVEKQRGSFWFQQQKGQLIQLVTTNEDELKTILSEIIHGFYVLEAYRTDKPAPKRKETGRVISLSKSIKKPEQVTSSTSARKPSAAAAPVPPREEKKQPAPPPASPPEATGGRSSRRKRRPPKRTMPGESSSGESSNNTGTELSSRASKKKKTTKLPTPLEDVTMTHDSSDASDPSVAASRRPYHWQSSPPPPTDDMMEALASFKKLFGHACIPPNWAGHPELATWAALQRQVYRETCRGYRPATAEEKELLQQLDPIQELDWNVKDSSYDKEQQVPKTAESSVLIV
jgi:hypothetical protein